MHSIPKALFGFVLLILCLHVSSDESISPEPQESKGNPDTKLDKTDEDEEEQDEDDDVLDNIQQLGMFALEQLKSLGEAYMKGDQSKGLKQTVAEGAKFLRGLLDIEAEATIAQARLDHYLHLLRLHMDLV
ncbi:unnamed protein product [Echinostoma caproni]|uniref:Secreted protein n=1 Tax=Echinostoma caproni TaxID=27848 RepID=A0A183AW04_9TREM|nr:unnamed protein product [Echinostoma caproni]